MVRRFLAGITVLTLVAACGSTAITPAVGQQGRAGDATSPGEAPWPSVEPPPAPTATPGPTERPTGTPASPRPPASAKPTASPLVTPQPTIPPIAPPWVLDGKVAVGGGGQVLLANGDLLLLGWDGRQAAIRDAGSGRWRIVAGLPAERRDAPPVALLDGSAIVVGGTNSHWVSYSSVYRFDPRTAAWQRLGALDWARSSPGVALLPDGRVLVAGGSYLNGLRADASTALPARYRAGATARSRFDDMDPPSPVTVPYASVEIFDPATGRSRMARPLACARAHPGVATLGDGRIMVADLAGKGCGAAEIYDPTNGSFTKTGDLPALDADTLARQGVDVANDIPYGFDQTMSWPTALGDGGALLSVSYYQKHGPSMSRSFRFRPAPNGWVQFGPTAAIGSDLDPAGYKCTKSYSLRGAALVPLVDGRLFVVGGSIPSCKGTYPGWLPVRSVRLFDPAQNTWAGGADMPADLEVYEGLRLADGSVLLLGEFRHYAEADPSLIATRYAFPPAP